MSEKPIIMSPAMVIALLEQRKTVTRRIMKPQPLLLAAATADVFRLCRPMQRGDYRYMGTSDGQHEINFKWKFQPGDVAWVQEAWRARPQHDHLKPSQIEDSWGDLSIRYEANDMPGCGKWGRYRNASFMCRWMSRIDLHVIDVRPERVQEITEEEARLEGFEDLTQFVGYWNVLHGPEAFDKNDWVWRYEFAGVQR